MPATVKRNPAWGGGAPEVVHVGTLNSSTDSKNRLRRQPLWSIYVGLDCVGEVVEDRASRFAAIDAAGFVLGVYPDARAARQAVILHRRSA